MEPNAASSANSRPAAKPPGASGQGLLEECIQRKQVAQAWDELEDMQRRGASPTRFAVSRLLMLTMGSEAGCPPAGPALAQRALDLATAFVEQHPQEADEVLFNALLDTCHRARDMPRLEKTILRMEELQVKPSHVTLGILVKAYGQAGDATRVVNLWDNMAEERLQANAVTCGCMIDACIKCGRLEKAMDIFADMKKNKKHRNTILYTTLIKGCGLKKDLRQALSLFREMKTERVPYNRITYNSVIDVCVKCSDVPAAENIFAEMTASGSGIEPDHITYSTLLKGYCHMGDLDKALQVAATIKASGLPCDEMVYNSLMDGCVRAGDLSAGIGLFAEMVRSGVQPSAISHGILVRLYQQSGHATDACEAVAQLYLHHGLPRPDAALEQRSKRGGGGRRGRRQRKAGAPAPATTPAPAPLPPPVPDLPAAPQLSQQQLVQAQLELRAALLQQLALNATMQASQASSPWQLLGQQGALPQASMPQAGADMLSLGLLQRGLAQAQAQAMGLPGLTEMQSGVLPPYLASPDLVQQMPQVPTGPLPQTFAPQLLAPPAAQQPLLAGSQQVYLDPAAQLPMQLSQQTLASCPVAPSDSKLPEEVQGSAAAESRRRAGLRPGLAALGGM